MRELAAAFDPDRLSAGFYEDPYPTYRALREEDPVHRCPDGSYFLTRYRDLDLIYRDRSRFSSDKQDAFAPRFGRGTPLFEHHTSSLVFNDPPYHTRVRRQIVGALTPGVLKAMEPGIRSLVNRLLDALPEHGSFDLIADYAAAIPIEVIGNLLGVPREEREPLRGWSLAILGALETTLTQEQLAAGQRAVTEFCEFLRTLISRRRSRPGGEEDLLTRLLHDAQLSERELLHNCIFLLNAGHETTTNLIGNGLKLLLSDPQSLQCLLAEPALIGSTVEECLRFESSNQLGNRMVVEPVTLGESTLPAGAYLTLCIGAANRDPAEFPEPDRFDIRRSPNRHLAFAAGAHACAGMALARLEAQIAILRAVQRYPGMRILEGAARSRRARFRGFATLPATVG